MPGTVDFTHSDTGVWSAEASDLGLTPGQWPAAIFARCGGELVSGTRSRIHRDAENEITHVDYRVPGRMTLRVWND